MKNDVRRQCFPLLILTCRGRTLFRSLLLSPVPLSVTILSQKTGASADRRMTSVGGEGASHKSCSASFVLLTANAASALRNIILFVTDSDEPGGAELALTPTEVRLRGRF